MSGPDTTGEQVRNALGSKYYSDKPIFQPVDADNVILKNQLKFQNLTQHQQQQAQARAMEQKTARLRAAAKSAGDTYIKKSGSALNKVFGVGLVTGAAWYYYPNIKKFFSFTLKGERTINEERSEAPHFFALPEQVPQALDNRDIISRFGFKHPPAQQ